MTLCARAPCPPSPAVGACAPPLQRPSLPSTRKRTRAQRPRHSAPPPPRELSVRGRPAGPICSCSTSRRITSRLAPSSGWHASSRPRPRGRWPPTPRTHPSHPPLAPTLRTHPRTHPSHPSLAPCAVRPAHLATAAHRRSAWSWSSRTTVSSSMRSRPTRCTSPARRGSSRSRAATTPRGPSGARSSSSRMVAIWRPRSARRSSATALVARSPRAAPRVRSAHRS